jgi:hypothetical protein
MLVLVAASRILGQPEPSAEQRQVSQLIAQIRGLAASEPVVYGIDTRLRTAAVVSRDYPKLARELLREAQAALTGTIDAGDADRMRLRMVELWAPLDLEEAERVIGSLHRGGEQDYIAQAYDKLCVFLAPHPDQVRGMLRKGFSAGAFRMETAARLLEATARSQNSEEAAALFALILAAFPSGTGGPRDVSFLLDEARSISAADRPLAIEAVDKALAVASPKDDKRSEADRTRMLRETARFLEALDPELLERYKSERKELRTAITAGDTKPEQEKKTGDDAPDLSAFTYPEALSLARKLDSLMARAEALIDLSRRPELSAQQRASVTAEALSTTAKLPLGNDRLAALAVISRDFAQRGELASAAFAAQLLSETFSQGCDCLAATCRRAGEDWDCLQNVEDFAEYLDEFKISPESMSLDNISLDARLLVLNLKARLEKK